MDLLKYHSNTSVNDFINCFLSNNDPPGIDHPIR